MELLRALAAYLENPSPRLAAALELPEATAAEQTETFAFQLYPYASVYAGAEGMLGGEARDRVAGFWRAVGLVPPAEPDHLAALLGLQASFGELEGERARHLSHSLLWEHLLSWLPPWLARLEEVGSAAHAGWASLLGRTLLEEAERLGPPVATPLHLRLAPAGEGWGSLLAPVRSGVILTRSDLARAARALGLGLRQGERRYILDALATQDPHAVLGWLSEEAARQARLHASQPRPCLPVAEHWATRARATAAELNRLASEAKEVVHAG